jgi:hypothetical protein
VNAQCKLRDTVFDSDVSDIDREVRCDPGQTLYNFNCVSCFDALHVDKATLPVSSEHLQTWNWLYECKWACFHALGWIELRARSGTHWECVRSTHWSQIMAAQPSSDAWSADAAVSTKKTNSVLDMAKSDLFIMGIVVGALPIFLIVLISIVRLVLMCQKKNRKDDAEAGAEDSGVRVHIHKPNRP